MTSEGLPCRLQANLGPVTDLEVIKTLERRGADKDWARKKQIPSERQVRPLQGLSMGASLNSSNTDSFSSQPRADLMPDAQKGVS